MKVVFTRDCPGLPVEMIGAVLGAPADELLVIVKTAESVDEPAVGIPVDGGDSLRQSTSADAASSEVQSQFPQQAPQAAQCDPADIGWTLAAAAALAAKHDLVLTCNGGVYTLESEVFGFSHHQSLAGAVSCIRSYARMLDATRRELQRMRAPLRIDGVKSQPPSTDHFEE